MKTSFYDLPLLAAPGKVFTPRPSTERLVDEALERIDGVPMRVADVGTGSGAVAIALAVNRPHVEVWATDTSPAAVELARENARLHGVEDRVHVLQGDLLEPITASRRPRSSRTFRICRPSMHDPRYDEEPPEAVYAPGDGLGPYRSLLERLPRRQARDRRHAPDPVPPESARRGLLAARGPARAARILGVDSLAMERREVVFVDGVRTAFGRAGPQGIFWKTRADDMAVKVVRELLRRNPEIPPERIGDVIYAATAQVGDQGLTLGRDVALLAGLPQTVPGFAIDRMCAGALTAVTAGAGEIAYGACDIVLAGGVEHMGHHPMGEDVDFNPRFVAERLVDTSAVTMGATAENLHDRFPQITKDDADAFAVPLAAARGGRLVERRHARDGRADERLHRRRLADRRPRRVPPAGHDARGARRHCARRFGQAAASPPGTRQG